jgi:dolichol-phosphate mannosyltransferase
MQQVATSVLTTVIVPTYNEADNLPLLVKRVLAALPASEIVVVDDASRDGTPEVARELARTCPVRLVERVDERGLSTAVLRGMKEARTDVCVVMDADLSHPPEAIPKLVEAVRDGADVAVGSRYVAGGDIDDWPLFRRLASRAGTILARPLTKVRDPMAGFFCLRRSLVAGVPLKPRGFKILLEILARTGTDRTVEVPIHFEDRAAGASKFDSRQRREFLRQVWTLYRDVNAWPWKLAKFLTIGFLGILPDVAVLNLVVQALRGTPTQGAVAGWFVAMTSNYALNRVWTFRARELPIVSSYLRYALGVLGGLAVKVAVLHALPHWHYNFSNLLGILAGTLFNYMASQLWAFAKR